tara:strand:+ start:8747 stop:9580 length:834 start_codon:yes stop_codon:yes gene_type:complete
MKIDPTVERLNFDNFSDTTVEHLHRYAITRPFILEKQVLDIASGEGYGSFLMSKYAKNVYGVDIDVNSILVASDKYKADNLHFKSGSAQSIPLENSSVDVVVSFETIEHHDMHEEMFKEIKRVLKPDGVLIMSSPDKRYYTDNTGYVNKYHIKELYFHEFQLIVQKYFDFNSFYFQKAYNLNSYISNYDDFNSTLIYSGDQKELFLEEIEPLYNIVISSNKEKYFINSSIFNGSLIAKKRSNLLVHKRKEMIYQSKNYRIGRLCLKPYYYLKKYFKD